MEEYSVQNNQEESFIEDNLTELTLDCLGKIQSTFLILHNSFFTVTNRELKVLKCFISKNSSADITKFLPIVGSNLKEESYDKTSIFYASLENKTVLTKNDMGKKRLRMEIKSIATPIKCSGEIMGYISLTTLNNDIVNILNIFIESLALNIERGLEKAIVKRELFEYLNLVNTNYKGRLMEFLSAKEKVILQYMLKAYSNGEIANELGISESTVKTYVRRIYEKCGTSNRVDTTIAIICNDILQRIIT